MTQPTETKPEIGLLRTQAFKASAEGRQQEARRLLESAIEISTQLGEQPDCEVLGDLAAMAVQEGELLRAIALSRKVLALQPQHDMSQFTLALCLSGVGLHADALRLHEELSAGERGARFAQEAPQLAAMTQAEVTRLRAIGSGVAGATAH
jgi:tetratricopeptide (TPR) repeat protein